MSETPSGGTCHCTFPEPRRTDGCPIHPWPSKLSRQLSPEEAKGVINGLRDVQAGRVKSLDRIDAELAVGAQDDPAARLQELVNRYTALNGEAKWKNGYRCGRHLVDAEEQRLYKQELDLHERAGVVWEQLLVEVAALAGLPAEAPDETLKKFVESLEWAGRIWTDEPVCLGCEAFQTLQWENSPKPGIHTPNCMWVKLYKKIRG